ncbi:hypothetical protein AF332_14620 [Sporosarcina globispora]|uniref:Outer surface protein n=1 Tax=Sporosarcina globispora TaxID=1459 RepID=A0A0M0GEM1_SPOGL|nr:MupG family TIM beta-alpha barrel fold protein [Sporosarcina globispora]KON87937.1 hypothetical protein AF332_14620 [Sporosarcina globispora]
MKRIGVSLYPAKSSFERDRAYLDLAKKYGFTRIFTSLLEIDGDKDEVVNKFRNIIEYGNSIGMDTILDINPELFEQLNISYNDLAFFKELGASGIRLDLGFTGAEEAKMTKNPYGLIIEVNMSGGTRYIDNIMSYQPNTEHLYASHNFYPQRYSGISQRHFEQTTSVFNGHHLHTGAFVTSQEGELGPWPVQTGLPTLEHHRNLTIHAQVSHFRLMGTIHDLLIGNAYASEEELKAMSEAYLNTHPAFEIEFLSNVSELEKKMILDEVHQYRGDQSEYMIRSSATRVKYNNEDIPANNTRSIKKGDIVICNNHFGQYRGEIQIALKDMENEGNRNKVGHLPEESIFLLDYLKPWSSFMFKHS